MKKKERGRENKLVHIGYLGVEKILKEHGMSQKKTLPGAALPWMTYPLLSSPTFLCSVDLRPWIDSWAFSPKRASQNRNFYDIELVAGGELGASRWIGSGRLRDGQGSFKMDRCLSRLLLWYAKMLSNMQKSQEKPACTSRLHMDQLLSCNQMENFLDFSHQDDFFSCKAESPMSNGRKQCE